MKGDIRDLIHSRFFVLLKVDADLLAHGNIAGAQIVMSVG